MQSICGSSVRTIALFRRQLAFRARTASLPVQHACRFRHALSQHSCLSAASGSSRSQLPPSRTRHGFTRCSAASAVDVPSSSPSNAPIDASAQHGSQPTLRLYNTMSRTKEIFSPGPDQGNNVSMYVCGVTVYSMSHIGHARAYVAFDALYRYLQQLQYHVMYVRNFTDIDDKIINRANELGEDPAVLSQRYIDEFHEDMKLLGCLSPTLEPRATEHIPAMISTIQQIIENGHGYAVDGDVFFDVASLPGYGRLSRCAPDDSAAGQRVEVDARKRDPADFALWKAAKPGEPEWDSPWGAGRPGWHIECSAMIRSLMGPVIDIHGGGRDLQFPHHENELAQSQAAACCCDKEQMPNSRDFVRYWVHNGFVNVDAEKMSKSLGNFFTIREAIASYAPSALRFWLVGTHYRAPVNYTQTALEEASERLYSIYAAVHEAREALAAAGEASQSPADQSAASAAAEILDAVHAGMCDDVNTAQAVAALSKPVTQLNDLLFTKKGKKRKDRLHLLAGFSDGIVATFKLLGLPIDDPPAHMQLRSMALKRAGFTEGDVSQLIQQRAAAREAKDFDKADAARARLADKGIMIMDSPQGTTWRPGVRTLEA